MAPFTKKAIIKSFLSLCGRKMPDRITVKNIVDDCEINRNTFYYYFQDIYAVIEDIFSSAAGGFAGGASLEEWTLDVARDALKYKKAVTNIYVSLGRDRFEEYLARALGASWEKFVRERAASGTDGEKVRSAAKISRYVFFGMVSERILSSMSEPPEQFAARLSRTVEGIVDFLLSPDGA